MNGAFIHRWTNAPFIDGKRATRQSPGFEQDLWPTAQHPKIGSAHGGFPMTVLARGCCSVLRAIAGHTR
jgi:hypothetical protein